MRNVGQEGVKALIIEGEASIHLLSLIRPRKLFFGSDLSSEDVKNDPDKWRRGRDASLSVAGGVGVSEKGQQLPKIDDNAASK